MSDEQTIEQVSSEFDLSKLEPQHHEWFQSGNQPMLVCRLGNHNHSIPLPQGMHAQAGKDGKLQLVQMG